MASVWALIERSNTLSHVSLVQHTPLQCPLLCIACWPYMCLCIHVYIESACFSIICLSLAGCSLMCSLKPGALFECNGWWKKEHVSIGGPKWPKHVTLAFPNLTGGVGNKEVHSPINEVSFQQRQSVMLCTKYHRVERNCSGLGTHSLQFITYSNSFNNCVDILPTVWSCLNKDVLPSSFGYKISRCPYVNINSWLLQTIDNHIW